jgi:hypothetical protein
MIAGGVSVIALVGGVAYLAFGRSSGHDRHSSHCCSSSCSSRSVPYSSYSSSSSSSNSNSSSSYSSSSGFGSSDPQYFERGRSTPYQAKKIVSVSSSKKNVRISGHFFTYPASSDSSRGSVMAYVRLPDGTVEDLGSLSFSPSFSSSLSYGPFKQSGTYFFGIRVEEGSAFASQIKIGSVEINCNDEVVKKHDFFVPAHSPPSYEPAPFEAGPF